MEKQKSMPKVENKLSILLVITFTGIICVNINLACNVKLNNIFHIIMHFALCFFKLYFDD